MKGFTGARIGAALAMAVALTPLVAGALYQARSTRRDDERLPGAGQRIDVGGYRLHVHTAGLEHDGPTVLFESGMSCPLEIWSWIQPEIARHAPTISYDRAGLGWSERGDRPRTAADMLDELDRALGTIGARPPYILVGHSFGGLLIRKFAQEHPDQVAGMVLLDSSHPDQLERSARQRLGMPLMKATVQNATFLSRFGVNRLSTRYPVSDVDSLPVNQRDTAKARMLTARTWQTTHRELRGWLADINQQVRASTLPPDIPLVVMTADESNRADPMHNELQQELAGLSANSRRIVVPEAGHLDLVMKEQHAKYVTEAVEDVLLAARTGGRLC